MDGLADPRGAALRVDLRIARQWGVPLSRYRGRETVQHTYYTRDEQGQVTHARTVQEPAWLESDRWLALALDVYEQSLCPGCQQRRDRAWHPDMEGWYEPRTRQCHACSARDGQDVNFAQIEDTGPPDNELHPLPDM